MVVWKCLSPAEMGWGETLSLSAADPCRSSVPICVRPGGLGYTAGATWQEVALGGDDPRWLWATCAPQPTVIPRPRLCHLSRSSWRKQAALLPGLAPALQVLHWVAEPVKAHGAQLASMMCSDHRITECSGLAGPSVDPLVQPPCQSKISTAGCTGPCLGGS